MKIKLILPATIAVIGLLQLSVNGYNAYEALQQRREAAAFVKVSDTASLLLTSAGEWALERGLSNAALRAKDPAPEATRDDIAKHRAIADKAFEQAVAQMRDMPEMSNGAQAIAAPKRLYPAFVRCASASTKR
jgi:hypothetical protein